MWQEHLEFLFRALVKVVVWRLTRTELERENLILLKENQILKRRHGRVALTRTDRNFYLALSQASRSLLRKIVVIRPETILGWHRAFVARKWEQGNQRVGRPSVGDEIVRLVIEMKTANPNWGAQKIMGELSKLGIKTCKASVQRILRDAGFPAGNSRNRGLSWRGFIQSHGKRLFACDFFTVDTVFLQKLHVFFMIDIQTRRVELVRVKQNPNPFWLRTVLKSFLAFSEFSPEILISDRDALFRYWLKPFLWDGYGIELRQTPPRMPMFNAYAERMVRTFREEVLDHVLIFGEDDLQRLMDEYVRYYNESRAHSALGFRAPLSKCTHRIQSPAQAPPLEVERVQVLGGLITDSRRAA